MNRREEERAKWPEKEVMAKSLCTAARVLTTDGQVRREVKRRAYTTQGGLNENQRFRGLSRYTRT